MATTRNGRAKVIKRAEMIAMRDKLLRERGPSTQHASGRWVNWDTAEDILGQPFDVTSIPLSKLHQMRRDPMIAFALLFIKLPLVRAPWYIECPDAKVASFVDNALRRIYARFVFQYTNSLDYGFSPMEKRFELMSPEWTYFDPNKDDAKELKVWPDKNIQALVWKPFIALPPDDVDPWWTKEGEFGGIVYRTGEVRPDFARGRIFPEREDRRRPKPDIPLDKALWVTNEKDSVFGSLWGYPRVAYAYRYWWSYWFRWALADRHFEKDADPPMRVYYPTEDAVDEDGNDVDYAEAALQLGEQARSGSTVAIPSDVVLGLDDKPTQTRKWEVDFIRDGGNFDVFNESFAYLDIMKVRSVWVPEQALMEGRGGTSSRNVAAEMGDILMESQAVLMGEIDDHLNRFVIPQLVEANFGKQIEARKKTRGFGQTDVDMMKAIVQLFGQADPTTLEVDMREILSQLGMPLLNPVQLAKEKAEAERMAKEQKPPEQESREGFAGVNQWGFYEQPREIIRLADQWIPETPHFRDEEVKATAAELRDYFEDFYGEQYGDFAKWMEEKELVELSEERLDLGPKDAAEKLLKDWEKTEEQVRAEYDRVAGWVRSIMDGAGEREVARVRIKDANFTLPHKDMEKWAKKHAADLVRNINDTTRDELRKFLWRELKKDQSPPDIAKAVRKHFAKFPGWKAERLARTEAMLAYNMGTLLALKAAGVKNVKAHDAAIIDRSDPDCIARDGKIFSIDRAFIEQGKEHPNGTLAWSPVQELAPIALSIEVSDELVYDNQPVPAYYDKTDQTIHLDSSLDDEEVETALLTLSEQLDLGPFARLRYIWDETKIRRNLKGQFADKPDVTKSSLQVKDKPDRKKTEYDIRKRKLEEKATKAVKAGTKAGKPAVPKEKRVGYLEDDPIHNPAGRLSQKRLLQYVNQAASPQHRDADGNVIIDAPTTAQKYSRIVGGKRVYDESRRVKHEEIIEELLAGHKSQAEPKVMFTGGGYAAGKGGLIHPEHGLLKDEIPEDSVTLDPDIIKSMLPEFDKLVETDPETNLALYEEAWDISQALQKRAQDRKINMVVDGISDTSPEEFLARVQSFVDAGYKNPKVVYVDAPTEEALRRARLRAENPKAKPSDRRYIPEVIMRAVHRDVAATIPGVLQAAAQDEDLGLSVELWDNFSHHDEKGDRSIPWKVASADPGQGVTVYDAALYDRVRAKAQEEIPGVSEKPKVTKKETAAERAREEIEKFEEEKGGYAAVADYLVTHDPEALSHLASMLGGLGKLATIVPPHLFSDFAQTLSQIFHSLPLSEQVMIDEDDVIELCEQALEQVGVNLG